MLRYHAGLQLPYHQTRRARGFIHTTAGAPCITCKTSQTHSGCSGIKMVATGLAPATVLSFLRQRGLSPSAPPYCSFGFAIRLMAFRCCLLSCGLQNHGYCAFGLQIRKSGGSRIQKQRPRGVRISRERLKQSPGYTCMGEGQSVRHSRV